MRTTITLEPDVAIKVKESSRRFGFSPKQVINKILRYGFLFEEKKLRKPKKVELITFKIGLKPEFQNVNFNHVDSELEDEHILEKLQL